MVVQCILRLAALGLLLAAAAWGANPVIVELFTSEGCSSCPPADLLLTRLEKEQPVTGAEIIALGQHVDYWNSLGWRDPFSSAEFTSRQQRYAQAFRNDNSYTPQMIVDGRLEFNGSDSRRAAGAIAQAAKASKAAVEAALNPGQQGLVVKVGSLPALSRGDTAEVLLAITEYALASNVTRGENAGRRLPHSAVVRQLRVLGKADAQSSPSFTAQPALKLDPAWKRENLRAVVLVQERNSRRIMGAAAVSLAPFFSNPR